MREAFSELAGMVDLVLLGLLCAAASLTGYLLWAHQRLRRLEASVRSGQSGEARRERVADELIRALGRR